MTSNDDRQLSEERARAVWHRAAQLQAEAARRLEERSRMLASQAGAQADGDGAPPVDGFRLAEVRAAAVEAGISPEFVELAVAELESGGDTQGLSGWQDRAATRLLRADRRTLELSRAIARPAAVVYDAMGRILPASPYFLALRDTVGDDPLRGAVLIFETPPLDVTNMTKFVQHAYSVDVNQLRFALRPLSESACELTVTTDLNRSVRRNWKAAGITGGITGAVGGAAGLGIAGVLSVAGALAALPAAAGALVLGGLCTWGYGAAYRSYFRKLTADLEQLLQSVDVYARTGGTFAPPSPGRGPGGDALAPLNNLLNGGM